jgi:1,4-dihydroxy-2-naphthoate polyprenyltransferase
MVDLRTGVAMIEAHAGLARLAEFPFALLTFVDESGYPVSTAVDAVVDPEGGRVTFPAPAGLAVPLEQEISLTGSHINPRPGYGYDERRHVTVWGRAQVVPDGRLMLEPTAAWGWDEASIPFPEYVERTVGQSRRYLSRLSAEVGHTVRPRLSMGWLFLRATRLPFLSATFIPVSIGLAIAAVHGYFDLVTALLTLVGAGAVHLGLNVANDIFDTRLGADDLNVNPTQYSGGSRVIQYGLVSLRGMTLISAAFYAIALVIGLVLLLLRGSPALLVIGVLGVVLSVGYTAPPLKLVYRGLGELTTAIGFGPLMLLGAYVVQTQGLVTLEPIVASLPIAILVAMILYVNEVPDRPADARAGKRTLPVRWSRELVITAYLVAVSATFLIIAGGVLAGLLPIPALAALVAIPLARQVYGGLQQYYESPYGLMAVMAVNVKLHMVVGALMLAAYLLVIAVTALALDLPLFLRWR